MLQMIHTKFAMNQKENELADVNSTMIHQLSHDGVGRIALEKRCLDYGAHPIQYQRAINDSNRNE